MGCRILVCFAKSLFYSSNRVSLTVELNIKKKQKKTLERTGRCQPQQENAGFSILHTEIEKPVFPKQTWKCFLKFITDVINTKVDRDKVNLHFNL